MINIGVIGYGYWGPNLVRNFFEAPSTQVTAISDRRPERLVAASARYPSVRLTTDYSDLINDPRVDAVAIATPVGSHFELAMAALKAGKHVLVEKPLTTTSIAASQLVDEAAARRLVLMVDHTFIYTSAVRKIHELLVTDGLGDLYYYDSVRINLGLFQHDVNVMWDLAVHDLAIMDYVLPATPIAVSANAISHVAGQPENIAYLSLHFDAAFIAHLHVNWLAPVKLRRTLISGSRKMIVYDDLEPSEKLKVYDKGLNLQEDPASVYQLLVGYRAGDMWAPQLEMVEALQSEVRHFAKCIDNGQRPETDGLAGLRVVRMLEAATQSVSERGRPVEIEIQRHGV